MKYISILLFYFVVANYAVAQDAARLFSKTDAFLQKNISNGKVNYQSIKNDPKVLLEIVDIIAKTDYAKENTNTQKAYLINAYNILLIKSVVDKYPVKSPMDIPGLFDKAIHTISGKKYSLNDLENQLIRAKFNDARVHFVLVCGANGCPPITDFAYTPKSIEEQLNNQTQIALTNPNFIKVNNASKKVELSQIFEWYKADFITKGKNEIDFINTYRATKIDPKYKISYYPYDWSLNKN